MHLQMCLTFGVHISVVAPFVLNGFLSDYIKLFLFQNIISEIFLLAHPLSACYLITEFIVPRYTLDI